MKSFRISGYIVSGIVWLAAAAVWLCASAQTLAAAEEAFDVLQIGTRTYTNVTVTTKAKDYIFILHSTGMANIRVTELSPELQEKLGYGSAEKKGGTNAAAAWASKTLSKIKTAKVEKVEKELAQTWRQAAASHRVPLPQMTPQLLYATLGVALLCYLFGCYCCRLICQKTGNPPGPLIWVPLLQMFPLLRAAGMSPWWFLAYFIPLLNVVAGLVWSVRIVQARGKSIWLAVFLVLPLTNLLAFLYLAFSSGKQPKEKNRRIQIMTLETA